MFKLVLQPPLCVHLYLEADQAVSLLRTPGTDWLAGSPRLRSLAHCTAPSFIQRYEEALFNYLGNHGEPLWILPYPGDKSVIAAMFHCLFKCKWNRDSFAKLSKSSAMASETAQPVWKPNAHEEQWEHCMFIMHPRLFCTGYFSSVCYLRVLKLTA